MLRAAAGTRRPRSAPHAARTGTTPDPSGRGGRPDHAAAQFRRQTAGHLANAAEYPHPARGQLDAQPAVRREAAREQRRVFEQCMARRARDIRSGARPAPHALRMQDSVEIEVQHDAAPAGAATCPAPQWSCPACLDAPPLQVRVSNGLRAAPSRSRAACRARALPRGRTAPITCAPLPL